MSQNNQPSNHTEGEIPEWFTKWAAAEAKEFADGMMFEPEEKLVHQGDKTLHSSMVKCGKYLASAAFRKLSEQSLPGRAWVKAQERLPVTQMDVFIRYGDPHCHPTANKHREVGNRDRIRDLEENGWLNVEWLEELPANHTEGEVAKSIAIEFAELVAYHYEIIAGKPGNGMLFEHVDGPAKSTTEELFKIFLSQRPNPNT